MNNLIGRTSNGSAYSSLTHLKFAILGNEHNQNFQLKTFAYGFDPVNIRQLEILRNFK